MIQVGKQCITRKGFTLVEALLVLALLAIVVAISMPLYQNLQVRTDLNNQANITAQTLLIASSSINLFSGNSYAARDINYDEVFSLPNSISPATSTELVFSKYWGLPNATATVTFYSVNNESRILGVNSQGTINY